MRVCPSFFWISTNSCVPRFGGNPLPRRNSAPIISAISTHTPMLNFIPALLTLSRFLSAEFRLDEHVDLAVHHFLDVARFGAGAVVFHHLIWLKNVGANLIAPRDLAFLAILSIDLGAFLVLLDLIKFRF